MRRVALPLSIAVIVAYWSYAATWATLHWDEEVLPDTVAALALYAGIKAAVAVGVVWLLLRANGEGFANLGFGLAALRQALPRGTLLGVGLFLFSNGVIGTLLAAFGEGGTAPAVKALFRDPRDAPLWVFCAVVGGGFSEELVRAFILTRFEQAFGRIGLILAILVDSVVFGMGHLYQGVTGAVGIGLTGLLFALIFLHRRRVADAMTAHAVYDLIGVAAAYALYAPAG